MHIILVISSLQAGGAERVLSEMANYWQGRGHTVALVTLDSTRSDFYPLDSGVRRIGLDLKQDSHNILRAVWNNLLRIKSLRRVVKRLRPQAIISFVDSVNILTILATVGLGVPVIVSERIDPRHHPVRPLWRLLRLLAYPWASAVVVQTKDVYEWMRSEMPRAKFTIIPNPARSRAPKAISDFQFPPGSNVVAVGRLAYQKGHDILIKAFAQCAQQFPEWNLVIFGEGKERVALESLASMYGLGSRIILPGIIEEPMDVLQQADIFVLSSRYEGFPNVLLEAMACGLSVIATDCPSGPREIVKDGCNGILVPSNDVDKLAHAMKKLMADLPLRQILGHRAGDVPRRFNMETVLGVWEELIDSVATIPEAKHD